MTDSAAASRLQSPETIRERCENIFRAGLEGELEHFEVHLEHLPAVKREVLEVTRRTYPDGRIPYHGRFRHFQAGGIDRLRLLEEKLAGLPEEEKRRARIELVATSVLLDAGAGPTWRYREADTGLVFSRSEGLAVASFHLFLSGALSHEPGRPCQATAEGLQSVSSDVLARGFQVSGANLLVGVEGRAALLRSLAPAMAEHPEIFGRPPRLGDLCGSRDRKVAAREILAAILEGFESIWPSRLTLDGKNLGDVWSHPKAGLVPFHKLSQWLTYSLIEPLEGSGVEVRGVDALTGLAEYRNGGLFLDLGVLRPKHREVTDEAHEPGSGVVVEWRALTVALLDRLAETVGLPLVKALEGGTWRAGRVVAERLRRDGASPIRVLSDGTVF
ncbi:MAG: DUF1688 family protein [Vicinamibacteria bacterium]